MYSFCFNLHNFAFLAKTQIQVPSDKSILIHMFADFLTDSMGNFELNFMTFVKQWSLFYQGHF